MKERLRGKVRKRLKKGKGRERKIIEGKDGRERQEKEKKKRKRNEAKREIDFFFQQRKRLGGRTKRKQQISPATLTKLKEKYSVDYKKRSEKR